MSVSSHEQAAQHDPFAHLSRLERVDGEPEQWRLRVPAKPACYLLEDAEHRPILLATVGDLRGALVRRLSEPGGEGEGGKRIDYREVVLYVRWRDVCSRFEGDWAYLLNARRLFADQWRKLTKHWRAWWVGVDVEAAHPRFVCKDRPFQPAGACFGPVGERGVGRRCIEALEDLFDLCREHHLLVQTPNATACAYKQMGKCPAPCDGTITMQAYREQLREATAFLAGERAAVVERVTERIRAASAELDFERAARLKAQLDQAAVLDHEAMRRLAPVRAFRYIVLQAGRRKRHVRAFVVTPGRIHFAGEMQPKAIEAQVTYLADLAERCFEADAAAPLAEAEMGLVGWHMLSARAAGAFVHRPDGRVDRAELAEAVRRVAEGEQDGERERTAASQTASDDA